MCHLESIPLLVGKDLLNRFEPLLDFKRLKVWAQVREPLTITFPDNEDFSCYVLESEKHNAITQIAPLELSEKLTPDDVVHGSPASQAKPDNLVKQFLAQRDTFLCALQP